MFWREVTYGQHPILIASSTIMQTNEDFLFIYLFIHFSFLFVCVYVFVHMHFHTYVQMHIYPHMSTEARGQHWLSVSITPYLSN